MAVGDTEIGPGMFGTAVEKQKCDFVKCLTVARDGAISGSKNKERENTHKKKTEIYLYFVSP